MKVQTLLDSELCGMNEALLSTCIGLLASKEA